MKETLVRATILVLAVLTPALLIVSVKHLYGQTSNFIDDSEVFIIDRESNPVAMLTCDNEECRSLLRQLTYQIGFVPIDPEPDEAYPWSCVLAEVKTSSCDICTLDCTDKKVACQAPCWDLTHVGQIVECLDDCEAQWGVCLAGCDCRPDHPIDK
jgi:hypothetical protein